MGEHMSTIRHFKIFIEVYQRKSVTKAATQLHLAQPSVSLAIKELEREYQIQLFERIGRKIYPTYYGDQFYQHALAFVSSFENIGMEVQEWKDHEQIHIGSSISIATCLLPSLMAHFQKSLPNVQMKVKVRNASNIEQDILDHKIDFAFVEGKPQAKNIQKQKIWEDTLLVVMHATHPLASKQMIQVEDLSKYPFLCREKGSASRDAIDAIFALDNVHVTPLLESVSNEVITEFLQRNLGIAVLPSSLIDVKQKDLVSKPFAKHEYSSSWYMIWHSQKYLSEHMKKLMNMAYQLCQEEDKHETSRNFD
ncbi:MAG: LysR family transcriptional regulator [Erysipelotrichia bacterium]|nr:LysR family transcriptional regulator [Erysipelotrichia bacterium]NCC54182.1 LysR family transcriptional regulator [Erysipelotrichia bacterium]